MSGTAPGRSAGATAPSTGDLLARRTLGRWAGTVLFVLAVVAPLLRERGVPVWDTVWVEDGPVYARQVLESGWSATFRGYFGYLQGLDRLLALPVAVLPSAWWAAYFAVVSTLTWALAAAFVYRSTAGWIRSAACRLALATLVVLAPAAAWETNASISNVMWAALFVTPFAFLSPRAGRADTAMRAVAVYLGVTSSPLAVFFLPLGLVAYARRRRSSELVVLGAFAVGAVVQVCATLTSGVTAGGPSSWRLVADLFGLRVVGSALVGEAPLDQLWTDVGEPAVVVLVLSFLVVWGLLLRRASAPARLRSLTFAGLAVVEFLVPVVGRGIDAIGFAPGVYTLSYTRLTIVPLLLLVTAVAVLVDPVEPDAPPARGWRVGFLVQTACVVLVGFSVSTVRGVGPSWSTAREAAVVACAGRPDTDVVVLTTTPDNFRWPIECRHLR